MAGEAAKLEPLWQKVDETQARIRELELSHSETRGQVRLLAADLHNIKQQMSEHRAESKQGFERLQTGLESINKGITAINVERAQQRGAGVSRREIFAWVSVVIGAVAAIVTAIVAIF